MTRLTRLHKAPPRLKRLRIISVSRFRPPSFLDYAISVFSQDLATVYTLFCHVALTEDVFAHTSSSSFSAHHRTLLLFECVEKSFEQIERCFVDEELRVVLESF